MSKFPPISTIKANLGLQDGGPIHAFFTESCFKYMMPFVPGGEESHLNYNVELKTDEIDYFSPDAHYLYNGILYVDPKYGKGAFFNEDFGFWSRPGITKISSGKNLEYHTPGTGAFWDNRMWSVKSDEVIKEVQDKLDRSK